MKNKPIKRSYISCIGASACEVTGSAYLVNHKEYQILLDCGMVQGHGDVYSNYLANYDQAHKLRPKTIDSILVSHANLDHHGLIPYLYGHGCKATTFVPEGNKKYLALLWEDSFNIMQSDCLKIEKKKGRKAPILYNRDDIEIALSHVIEIPYNYPVHIGKDITFEFLPAGHIQHSASIYLTLMKGYIKKTLWYSGDLGPSTKQMYVEEKQFPKRFDIGIVENTYNVPTRVSKSRDREKDLEKIVSIVNEYNRTIFPSFALNRSQVIITELYKLWRKNKIPKDIKIYFDAPLGIRISNCWDGEEWDEIWNHWPNLIKLTDHIASKTAQQSKDKCIVIAGAGMCTSGRILGWLKNSVCSSSSHLVFIGYCPPEGLAADIKSNKKYITIDNITVENKCNYTELVSFSSHASYEELMDYYSNVLVYNKIALVHGEFEPKVAFANTLQNNLIAQGKSSRVIATNADSKIYF